jgi:hypothetical protein
MGKYQKELLYIYENLIIPTFSLDWYTFAIKFKVKINGIKITYNKIDQRTLINILQYYLILNEYYLYDNIIYERIKDTEISYKEVGTIENVLYEKFQENVVKFFLINFNSYFNSFDFNYVLVNYFIKSKNIIENLIDITTNKIILDFSLMEFTDGIYSIKYNTFINKNQIKNIDIKNKYTIKYYNKSFNRIRQDKPKN